MISPSIFGKLKASMQFWAIGFVLMDFSISFSSVSLADFVVYVALFLSYFSGYQYISEYLKNSK